MKKIASTALLSVLAVSSCCLANAVPDSTVKKSTRQDYAVCPTVDAKNFKHSIIYKRDVYSAKLNGTPALDIQTDLDNKGPAQSFDMMMLTPISPYFVSCWYNKGELVLKTQKGHFYTTNKTCKLIGAKVGDVQTTSVASICSSKSVNDCKLVCR